MPTISEILEEMKNARRNSPQLVRDWREMIPAGSRWHPGDPGNPNCKECDGTGYLRIEGLPVTHKYFGKVVFCDCTSGRIQPKQLTKDDDYLLPEREALEEDRRAALDTGERTEVSRQINALAKRMT